MTRDEALQWCVKHVEEWPEGFTPSFAPNGWSWGIYPNNNGMYLFNPFDIVVITREDWLKAVNTIHLRVQLPGVIHNVPVTFSVYDPQPDTTPCGQSFHDLMRDLSA